MEHEAKRCCESRSRKTLLENFVDDYLQQDGVFLIRMLALNAGDVLAADVVGMVWQSYRDKKYEEINSAVTTPTSLEMPSAPNEKIQKIEVGFV